MRYDHETPITTGWTQIWPTYYLVRLVFFCSVFFDIASKSVANIQDRQEKTDKVENPNKDI